MDLEKSVKNGFSNIYSQYVQNGFPDNWRYVLRTRILVVVVIYSHFKGRSSEETILYDREVEKIKKRKRRDHPSFQIPPSSSEQPEPLFRLTSYSILYLAIVTPTNPSFLTFPNQETFPTTSSFPSFGKIPLTTTEQPLPSSVEMMEHVFPVKSLQNPIIPGNEVYGNDLLSVFQQLPKPKRRPGRPKGSKNKVKRAPGEKKKPGRKRKPKSDPIPESTLSLQLPISDVSSSMIKSNAMPLDLPLDPEETHSDIVAAKAKESDLKQSRRKGRVTMRKGKRGTKEAESLALFPQGDEPVEDPPIEQLARKGTLKYRNQIRQLVEKHDTEIAAENEANQKHLFEDNSSFDPNLFLNVKDPQIQTSSRKNSLDTLSFSLVGELDERYDDRMKTHNLKHLRCVNWIVLS